MSEFKLRSGNKSPFKQMGSSPAKHTTNREGHEDSYGKGHTNKAHPKYWKVKKRELWVQHDGRTPDGDVHTDPKTVPDTRKHKVKNLYITDKDMEKQDTDAKKRGKNRTLDLHSDKSQGKNYDPNAEPYEGTSTKDRTGKIKSSSKPKVKKAGKKLAKKGKLPSYEASYTATVADKWKDKGGKAAYIKAAKAWNARNRK